MVMEFGKADETEFGSGNAAAFLAFSLEGADDEVYDGRYVAIEEWISDEFGENLGFANAHHASSAAVIMG
jgi:hypothetical protein